MVRGAMNASARPLKDKRARRTSFCWGERLTEEHLGLPMVGVKTRQLP